MSEAPDPEEASRRPHERAPPGAPYPGLRPYRRSERHLFFGRERDAEILGNKILASRVTLMFGQSGRGKSSLLRTLLIPWLEGEGSRVFAFDTWSSEDPLGTLTHALRRLVADVEGHDPAGLPAADDRVAEQAPDPGTGRRRRLPASELVTLARRLTAYDPRPLVLVLDQFEELFVRHGSAPITLGRELAALVRAGDSIDLRIVIALREEFLASLETLRREIPTIFDSTFRLEPLSPAALREAIVKPAGAFGVTVEPALVDRLIADVDGTARTADAGQSRSGWTRAELPLLQIVLSEFWRIGRRDTGALTLATYEQFGAAGKILADYVERVMPRDLGERWRAARLLQHLAPPSGFKAALSVNDLTEIEGLGAAQVERLLAGMEAAGIVRTREYRGQKLYELQHDAFIGVLSPWRDEVLRRARRRRGLIRSAAVAAVVALVAAVAFLAQTYVQEERVRQARALSDFAEEELRRATETRIAELRRMKTEDPARFAREAPQRLDDAARRLVGMTDNDRQVERALSLLRSYEDLLPDNYGLFLGSEVTAVPPPDSWPFSLEYSPRRPFGGNAEFMENAERLFRLNWQFAASSFARLYGIPLPALKLKADPALSEDTLVLRGPDKTSARETVPRLEGQPILSLDVLDTPAAQPFLAKIKDQLVEVPDMKRYVSAPRWTIPLWKALGIQASDGTFATAFSLSNRLLTHPQPILSPTAVAFLLDRVARLYPQTVADARAIRGPRLVADLVELVSHGNSLVDLHIILDLLSSSPEASSAEIAQAYDASELSLFLSGSGRITGPAPPVAPNPEKLAEDAELELSRTLMRGEAARVLPSEALKRAIAALKTWRDQVKDADDSVSRRQALEGAAVNLPEIKPKIRVYLSPGVRDALAGGAIRPDVQEAISAWRDAMARRLGLIVPGLTFRDVTPDWPIDGVGFRIAVLDQGPSHPEAVVRPAHGNEQDIRLILAELEVSLLSAPHVFLDSETTQDWVERLPAAVKAWISTKFGNSDLKFIMRAVLARTETSSPDGTKRPPSDLERTIRHAGWLLPGLVFFEPMAEQRIDRFADFITRLQIARATTHRPPVGETMQRAIAALLAGNVEEANRLFGPPTERPAREQEFIDAYAAAFPAWRQAGVEKACAIDNPSGRYGLTFDERLDAEDLLAEGPPDGMSLPLRLCLLGEGRTETSSRALGEVLRASGAVETWPPKEAGWLGETLLRTVMSAPDREERFALIERLLARGMSNLDASSARRAFSSAIDACPDAVWARCTHLVGHLVLVHPQALALDGAGQLALGARVTPLTARIALALAAVSQARPDPTLFQGNGRPEMFLRVVRVCALAQMSEGQTAAEEKAAAELRAELARPLDKDLRGTVRQCLLRVLATLGRQDEMRSLIADGAEETGDPLWIVRAELAFAFARADQGRILEMTRRLTAEEPSGISMGTAVGVALLRTTGWEEALRRYLINPGPDRDLVLIIAATLLKGPMRDEAQDRIRERWRSISRSGWDERIRDGDPTVWNELLLGVFEDKLGFDRDAMAADLADEARFASSRLASLPKARLTMLQELRFYEGMRAKRIGDEPGARAFWQDAAAIVDLNSWEYVLAKYVLAVPE